MLQVVRLLAFSYLAELFNEVGRFTGAIGEGEYNANASKIAADQKSFSADVEAVKNIMKIKNIDEKYATTYSESFLGGLADTAAVMLGAYAGGTLELLCRLACLQVSFLIVYQIHSKRY